MRSDHHSRVPTTGIVIRRVWIMIVPLLAAGCATQRSVTVPTQAAQQPPVVAAASPTKAIETRYEVRGYREATNPQVRHEAHAVYRSTRVPVATGDELSTVPRTAYPVASYTPLPASDELAAELATQRSITADIRTIRTSMVETERRVQSQYATLVRESAEALKVREQLEAERARARAAVPASTSAAPVAAPAGGTAEVKW
jgi:hypothetical protein